MRIRENKSNNNTKEEMESCGRSPVAFNKPERNCFRYFIAFLCASRFWICVIILLPVLLFGWLILQAFSATVLLVRMLTCRSRFHETNLNVLEASALVQLCNIKVISKWIDIKDSEGVNFRVHTLAAFKDGEHDVNKPTLLLVHGAGSGALVWVPTFDNLVNDFNIYALDLPGFGRSMSPPSLYKCKTSVECQDWFVDFLELYCVSMKLEKIVYAGHSFGGCIGVSFCFRRSYLISKVILIDCGGFSPLPGDKAAYLAVFFKTKFLSRVLFALSPFGRSIVRHYLGYNNSSAEHHYWFKLLSGGEGLIGDKIVSHYVTTSLITGFDSWNCLVLPELFKLRVPLALIYGEDDFVTPLMEGRFVSSFAGSSIPLYAVKQVGHNPVIDRDSFLFAFRGASINAKCFDINAQKYANTINIKELATFKSSYSLSDTRLRVAELYDFLSEGKHLYIGAKVTYIKQSGIHRESTMFEEISL